MNRSDTYGALARLLMPQTGDPPAGWLLDQIPGSQELREVLPESLTTEFETTFGHTTPADFPPYETSYGTSHVFMQTNAMADIAGFYRAFGVLAGNEERLDHLAVELEFMQFLAAKEEHALRFAGPEQVEVVRGAQRTFLRDHLGRWTGAFAARLKQHGPSPFYRRLAEAIAEFVAGDCRALDVEPPPVSAAELKQSEAESDWSCGGCNLAEFQS
jgi:TorA maturation chaperone TorD